MSKERAGAVTMKGNPITLIGPQIKTGDAAPAVKLVANDLSEVSVGGSTGTVQILSVVPSIDTPVCDQQTRRFNEEAAKLGDTVSIVTVSVDLPFAQKRYCGAAGIDRVKTLSDHREGAFGAAYGCLIKGLRLLARAIFVVDGGGKVRHAEYVGEVTQHPDYDAALAAARACL